MQWLTPKGVVNVGVGVINGNTLSVGYVGTTAGVVVYKLNGNKELAQGNGPISKPADRSTRKR